MTAAERLAEHRENILLLEQYIEGVRARGDPKGEDAKVFMTKVEAEGRLDVMRATEKRLVLEAEAEAKR